MALAAAGRYMAFGDTEIAERFVAAAEEMSKSAIPDPERTSRLAALQYGLSFFALRKAPAGAVPLPPAANGAQMEAFAHSLNPDLGLAALRAYKAKALASGNYLLALEINALESRDRRSRFQPFAAALQAALPAGQTLTAVIESENKIHRIRLRRDAIEHDIWDRSARELRTRIARSVHARSRGDDHELSRIFRSMVYAPINRSSYLYLSPGFLLAPVYAEPGDRIFVVADLEQLARPAVSMDRSFDDGFKVYMPLPKRIESVDPEDRSWDERTARMEEIAVGTYSRTKTGISHLMDSSGISDRIDGTWFLSVSRHGPNAMTTVRKYEADFTAALRAAAAPGVVYVDTGAGEWAVRFIRYYYDRDSGIQTADRRYLDAHIRLRRQDMGPLNVRMASPVLIND